jgi:hypothetical protein
MNCYSMSSRRTQRRRDHGAASLVQPQHLWSVVMHVYLYDRCRGYQSKNVEAWRSLVGSVQATRRAIVGIHRAVAVLSSRSRVMISGTDPERGGRGFRRAERYLMRAVGAASMVRFTPRWPGGETLPATWCIVQPWCGLRGAQSSTLWECVSGTDSRTFRRGPYVSAAAGDCWSTTIDPTMANARAAWKKRFRSTTTFLSWRLSANLPRSFSCGR